MKFRKLLSMLLIVAILGLTAVAEDSLVIQAELDGEAIPAESETLLSEAEDRMPAEEPLLIEDEAPEQGEPSQAEPQANASSLSDFQIENGVLKKYVGSGGDVVIPGSVTSIGESAFSCCDSVTSVVVPDSVTFIGEYAFVSCRNMTSITLPKGLSSLEWNLFGGCSKLKSVNIPNGITRIEGAVFSHCTSLPSITIPESVNSIGEDAFSGCESLKKITIPSGVTSIENGTFRQCKNLKTVNLPEGITNIGDTAFWDCASLTSLAIPSTVTTMGSSMFWNCTSLVSIIIPDSATGLWGMPFRGCTSLTTVVLSKSMDYLDGDIFEGCGNLATVVIPKSVTTIFEGTFKDCPNVTVYVEAGSYAEQWCKKYGVRYQVGEPPVTIVTPTPSAKPTTTTKPPVTPKPKKRKTVTMDEYTQVRMEVGDEIKIAVDEGTIKSCSIDKKGYKKFVSVDGSVVTAKAQGTATITIKTKKPSKKYYLTVVVTDPTMPQKITLDHNKIKLKQGEDFTPSAKVKPATAKTGLKWESSNKSCVTVDSKGKITALRPGQAVITVFAKKDEAVKASITVTVEGKYRALLIGNRKYVEYAELKGAINDATAMEMMLKGLKDDYKCTLQKNRTKEQMLKDIYKYLVKPSSEGDVSLFYFSGHGMGPNADEYQGALAGTDTNLITTYELAEALGRIKGRVIVIIDACYSGALISKNSGNQTDAGAGDIDAFVDGFIRAFKNPSVISNAAEFRDEKYIVLVAAGYNEESKEGPSTRYDWGKWTWENQGKFTAALIKGMGCDFFEGTYSGKTPADSDKNKCVSVIELYNYIKKDLKKRITKQKAGYYAKNKKEILFAR